jgi:nicotinate-nucleotide--dimethylbenzimidazole phosphoribosyltransferase
MSVDGWNAVLVLGGIRSGKSQFAESLVRDAAGVRYVATAAPAGVDDPEWGARIAAHQRRRPAGWKTEEVTDPARLIVVLAEAKPDETLLVDDLGGWVAARLGGAESEIDPGTGTGPDDAVNALAAAVRGCAARLVLVSPEAGLTVVPATRLGRAFADALGDTNQAVAAACDAVVLVVAGQATWLKPSAAEIVAVAAAEQAEEAQQAQQTERAEGAGRAERASAARAAARAFEAPLVVTPRAAETPTAQGGQESPATEVVDPPIEVAMDLPMPDEEMIAAARARLRTLDLPGAGLGELARVVTFAAGGQAVASPQPWRSPRLLLLRGDHEGGASAGAVPGEADRRVEQVRSGTGPLARLAERAGADMAVVEVPGAAAMEDGPALDRAAVDAALEHGRRLAADAVAAGTDVIVLGSCGTGTEAAAAAVVAATAGAEPAALLPRVVLPGGLIDDNAWMLRCAAVRDALHRSRRSPRGAHDVLVELGGGDIAVATGVLLGATTRRTPVILDGPVGVAAALVSRDLAGQARHWCLLPDDGGNPLVKLAADVLGLIPLTDLRLDLGEGATGLAALPLLTAALEVAVGLPEHPALADRAGAGAEAETADTDAETADTDAEAADTDARAADAEAEAADAGAHAEVGPTGSSGDGG